MSALTNVLWTIGEEALMISIVEALKVEEKLLGSGGSPAAKFFKMGVVWTLADEIITFLKTQQSMLINGEYFMFIDQVLFSSATVAAIEMLGIGERVVDLAEGVLPFSNDVSSAVATGVLKVSTKVLAELIDRNYKETPLNVLLHPTQLLKPYTAGF
jgi:hypothetical protein